MTLGEKEGKGCFSIFNHRYRYKGTSPLRLASCFSLLKNAIYFLFSQLTPFSLLVVALQPACPFWLPTFPLMLHL